MEESKKKPRQSAVALHYNPDEHAPKVVAKGGGVIAEKIIEKAEEADIAVYQDAELVKELTKMDLGQHIPPELYEVVAQILIFINDLDHNEGIRKKLDLERLKPSEPSRA